MKTGIIGGGLTVSTRALRKFEVGLRAAEKTLRRLGEAAEAKGLKRRRSRWPKRWPRPQKKASR